MTVDIGGPFVIAERYGNGLYVCNAGVNSILLRWFPLLRPSHSGTSA
jgi:hypothetical protein